MKRIFYIIILLFSVGIAQKATAQQYPLFTNYVLNTYTFNPAVIGTTEKLDIRGTYRSQWVGVQGAPTTGVLAINGRLGKTGFNIGAYVFNDVAGRLQKTGGNAMVAYGLKLGENSTLSIGATFGYYKLNVVDDVFAQNPIDPIITGAQIGQAIPDLSFGVYFKQKDGLFGGISVPQLYKKDIFFDPAVARISTTQIVRQFYGIVGYDLKVAEQFVIEPSALVKISPNVNPQVDVSVRGIFNNMFFIGGSYRSEDAVAAMAGIDKGTWYAAYSYDVTTSLLSANSSGSHELTLGFRLGKKKCKDEDGDGICDDEDKCPKEPGTKENKGCPEKKKEECPDKDHDGVCDKDDACPDVPGPKENKGCPTNDRDGDGVRDDIDKCPDIPG